MRKIGGKYRQKDLVGIWKTRNGGEKEVSVLRDWEAEEDWKFRKNTLVDVVRQVLILSDSSVL